MNEIVTDIASNIGFRLLDSLPATRAPGSFKSSISLQRSRGCFRISQRNPLRHGQDRLKFTKPPEKAVEVAKLYQLKGPPRDLPRRPIVLMTALGSEGE